MKANFTIIFLGLIRGNPHVNICTTLNQVMLYVEYWPTSDKCHQLLFLPSLFTYAQLH